MTPTKKSSKLPKIVSFSKTQLIIFMIVFGLIGGYLLLRSFASPNVNLTGDLDGNNVVNSLDLEKLKTYYGLTTPEALAAADINKDGSVNIIDLSILASHWGGVYVPVTKQKMVSQFRTGASLTQDTFEYGSNSAAVSAGRTLMLNSTYFLNVHLMGFGPGDPEPSPGTYSWKTLDTRINTNMADGSGIVLTACCAPSWMKGGALDFGDGFEVAPIPEYYDEYANLVATAVDSYPQIQYVQVWNEMKGFWNSSQNRWNYEGYTDLYNKVWAKVKAVRSSVKIGGPYVVLSSNGASHPYNSNIGGAWGKFDQRDLDVVTYWLQHKTGADFITVDGKNSNKDGTELVDAFARSDKFQAAVSWIRSQGYGADSLPIWWAEWYGRTGNDADSQAYKNAVMATGLIRTLKSGVDTALIWGPEGDSAGNYHPLGLFSDTHNADGGAATPFYTTQKYLHDYFSSGTVITDASSSNSNVELLASPTKLLLVNKTATPQATQVLGANYTLFAYEVVLKDIPPDN